MQNRGRSNTIPPQIAVIRQGAGQQRQEVQLWSSLPLAPTGRANCVTCRHSTILPLEGTPLGVRICLRHGENKLASDGTTYLIAKGPYEGHPNGFGLSLEGQETAHNGAPWYWPSIPSLATHPYPLAAYMNTDGNCQAYFNNQSVPKRIKEWFAGKHKPSSPSWSQSTAHPA